MAVLIENRQDEIFVVFDNRYVERNRGIDGKTVLVQKLVNNNIECWLDNDNYVNIKIKNITIRLESFNDNSSKLKFVCEIEDSNPMENILGNCLMNTDSGNSILCDFMLHHLFLNKIVGDRITINECEKLYLSCDNKLFFINSTTDDTNDVFVIQYDVINQES